jgi:hypothetical protein
MTRKRAYLAVLALLCVAGMGAKFAFSMDGFSLRNDHVQQAVVYYDLVESRSWLPSRWVLPVNNYFFTDYPVYFLVGGLRGWSPGTVRASAFLVVALIGIVLFLVLRKSHGSLVGFSALAAYSALPARQLLMPNYHVGVIMLSLLCLMLLLRMLDRSPDPPGRRAFVALCALLFGLSVTTAFSDGLFVVLFCVPVLLVLLTSALVFRRALLSPARMVVLSAVLMLGAAAGIGLVFVARDLELIYSTLTAAPALVRPQELPGSLSGVAKEIFSLLEIDFYAPGESAPGRAAKSVGFLIFGFVCLRIIPVGRKLGRGRESVVLWFFLFMAVVLVAVYTLSVTKKPYYLSSLFVVYSVFVAFVIAELLDSKGKVFPWVFLTGLTLFSVHAAYANVTARVPQQNERLVSFLNESDLSYGYGTVENSNLVTLLSANEVRVRAVSFRPFGVEPYLWQCKLDWYEYGYWSGPTFLMVKDGETRDGFEDVSAETLQRVFGTPSRILRFEETTVYVWEYNIIRHYWDALFRGNLPAS